MCECVMLSGSYMFNLAVLLPSAVQARASEEPARGRWRT